MAIEFLNCKSLLQSAAHVSVVHAKKDLRLFTDSFWTIARTIYVGVGI